MKKDEVVMMGKIREYMDAFSRLEFDLTEEEKEIYLKRLLSLAKYKDATHSEYINVLLRLLTFAKTDDPLISEALFELQTFGRMDGYGTDLKHIIITGLYSAKCKKSKGEQA